MGLHTWLCSAGRAKRQFHRKIAAARDEWHPYSVASFCLEEEEEPAALWLAVEMWSAVKAGVAGWRVEAADGHRSMHGG
jgi:hypothetical protein